METVLFLATLLAIPVAIGTGLTAILALVVMAFGRAPATHRRCVVVGSMLPALMLAYGQYLAWPSPWWGPDTMPDGIPPGSLLMFACLPSWPFCLLASRLILRPRRG